MSTEPKSGTGQNEGYSRQGILHATIIFPILKTGSATSQIRLRGQAAGDGGVWATPAEASAT